MTLSLAVLLSGSGSNLQAIIDRIEEGRLGAEIALVISNVPDAYGLKRAGKYNIPVRVISHDNFTNRREHDLAVLQALDWAGVDVVVLAGYMRLISKEFVRAYPQRILNIHPALLPAFKGLEAQKQAAGYGVKITGATVHFVDEYLDHGPIIIQAALGVPAGQEENILAKRILSLEHRIYPQAIQWLAQNRLYLQNSHVHLRPSSAGKADLFDLEPCLINPPLEEGF